MRLVVPPGKCRIDQTFGGPFAVFTADAAVAELDGTRVSIDGTIRFVDDHRLGFAQLPNALRMSFLQSNRPLQRLLDRNRVS